jgi:hypothetical protein
MKILISSSDIANTITNLTNGFRRLGFHADSFCTTPNKLYSNTYTYTDINFFNSCSISATVDGRVKVTPSSQFLKFIDRYDVFIFVAGTSLLPRMIDVPIIKAMGKTIICRQCGTEVRDYDLANLFWAKHGRTYPFYNRDKSSKKEIIKSELDVLELSPYNPSLANKLHNTRISELYADVITSGPPSQTLGIRPYMQSGPIFNPSQCIFNIPKRKKPVILHAPSSTLYKQTDIILNSLHELSDNGLKFDVDFITNVPHEIVLQRLANADILIDELSCGAGVLAYEGMASGCIVLGGHTGAESPLPFNRPIYTITKNNIKERITNAVNDLSFRIEMAEKGRDFINKGFGSPENIANYLINAIKRSNSNEYDIYPTLFSENVSSLTEHDIPEYIKNITLNIIEKFGVYNQETFVNLLQAGHIASSPTYKPDLFWDRKQLKSIGPWVTIGPTAGHGFQ